MIIIINFGENSHTMYLNHFKINVLSFIKNVKLEWTLSNVLYHV